MNAKVRNKNSLRRHSYLFQPMLVGMLLIAASSIVTGKPVEGFDSDSGKNSTTHKLSANESARWVGTYSSPTTDTLTLKKIKISKRSDGSLELHLFIVGGPGEVSERKGTAEPYVPVDVKKAGSSLIARFTEGKFKQVVIVSTTPQEKIKGEAGAGKELVGGQIRSIDYSYYMREIDGSAMRMHGTLQRDRSVKAASETENKNASIKRPGAVKSAGETIVTFPAVSIGSIDIIKANDDPMTARAISKTNAKGKVTVPAGCAINLTLNYNGSQDTSFMQKIPPGAIVGLDCKQLEFTDREIANIGHLTGLVKLDVEMTDMTDAAASQLRTLTELRELNMGNTLVTPRGLSFIDGMTKLQWLRLSRNNKLGPEIAPRVSKLKTLKMLDLCGTSINDDTLASLASLNKLEDLTLRRNNITDKGMVHVAKLTTLTRLDITDTRTTAEGLMVLSKLSKLKTLVLRLQAFKRDDLTKLHTALPNTKFENGSKEIEYPKDFFAPLH